MASQEGMEKEIIIGLVGLIGVYVIYHFVATRQPMRPLEADSYGDILKDEKYKVKGQWDR